VRVQVGPQAMEPHFCDIRDILLSLPDLCQLKVVFREWNYNLNSEYEYRGFVHEGRLNALSQYNGYLYLPELSRDTKSQQLTILLIR
jgi:hypothetical protein